MKKNLVNLLRVVALGFYILLWVGGVVSYLFLGGPPADTEWAAPAFLVTAALCVVLSVPRSVWPGLLLVGFVAFLAEWVGVATGFPFGAYRYTKVLFPHVLGVPVPIACAWIILFVYVQKLLAGRFQSRWVFALIAAAWMVALDLLIDPLAAGPLDYWRWQAAGLYCGIPVTNFAGWYLVSFLLFVLTPRRSYPGNIALWIGLSVVVFFVVIAVGRAVWPAAMVGLILCVLHVALRRL